MKKKILIGILIAFMGTIGLVVLADESVNANVPPIVKPARMKYNDTYGVIIDCNDSSNDKCII